MLRSFFTGFFVVVILWGCQAQDSIPKVKFDRDFKFNDGIYMNFTEWKENAPRLTEFEAMRTNAYGAQDQIELRYVCDSGKGNNKVCTVENCFAYVLDNKLFLSQGFSGYYYRVFIIGSLTHFTAYTGFDMDHDYYYSNSNGMMTSDNDFQEYLLDFETGQAFPFTYKIFVEFLARRDTELYQELMNTPRKRKMIHHFLLQYNERHPIYFPTY